MGALISRWEISSHPRERSREWWGEWRKTSVPMKIPRSRLRMTAYHIVVASPVPAIRSHGRGGRPAAGLIPAATSWAWVAT